MQPMYDFGGSGPVINLAVANGFPPQTYLPFIKPLTDYFHVVCLLPRSLWGEPPPTRRMSWRELVAHDLINGLREQHLSNTILIGHSFGGIASLIAAMDSPPERVGALILLDPTILTPMSMFSMRMVQLFGGERGNPLAQRAMKRQTHFDSVEAAYEKFKNKRLFADWHDEAVRQYAESMVPDGDKVRLAWSREWEAYFFKTLYTNTWNDIHDWAGRVPVLTVRGGNSDTFVPAAARKMQRLMPEMTYKEIEGHGHLFPQSAPDATRDVIVAWLREQGLMQQG